MERQKLTRRLLEDISGSEICVLVGGDLDKPYGFECPIPCFIYNDIRDNDKDLPPRKFKTGKAAYDFYCFQGDRKVVIDLQYNYQVHDSDKQKRYDAIHVDCAKKEAEFMNLSYYVVAYTGNTFEEKKHDLIERLASIGHGNKYTEIVTTREHKNCYGIYTYERVSVNTLNEQKFITREKSYFGLNPFMKKYRDTLKYLVHKGKQVSYKKISKQERAALCYNYHYGAYGKIDEDFIEDFIKNRKALDKDYTKAFNKYKKSFEEYKELIKNLYFLN